VPADRSRGGVGWALLAYGSWGVFPIYWKQLQHVPPAEVLSHRVLWSCVLVGGVLLLRGRGGELREALATRATRRALLASTALIAVNWFLFIWAVASGRILEASLGYYVNPLVNVALGRVVLGERLSRPAQIAVALAAIGVVVMGATTGAFPWLSLVLAITFGLYGLCRKMAPVAPLVGLGVETLLTAPLAIAAIAVLGARGDAVAPGADLLTWAFLVGSGAATAIPLVAFAEAARRLRYSTLGITQYVAPTLQLACAVLIYGEPFTHAHAVAFAFIWAAVALYAGDTLRSRGAKDLAQPKLSD
jgi:chloramphenicol-sensitive protein RarD